MKTDNKPLLLIVDDEKTQREGLRAVLEEHYDVYLADDAEAAMNLLEVERFDVLLTDYRMPKEDGLALIVRAKSLAKPPVFRAKDLGHSSTHFVKTVAVCACGAQHSRRR